MDEKKENLKQSILETKAQVDELRREALAQSKNLEEKASALAAEKHVLVDKGLKMIEELATGASVLASISTERSELKKSIKALNVCVGLMGQVKTTFVSVRGFWQTIGRWCRDLGGCDTDVLNSMSPKCLKEKSKKR